ncbi:hypothetical protein LJC68_05945 [Bacteroidales bacterium OttesenSCG-928-B11]|nr:hypothetical protein [Bacteroidales bacterium OttesenSCG-928-C03]MDL2312400.1 hypothetical protein [Bacteroidales bacterium OttesenSCG-928-B11]
MKKKMIILSAVVAIFIWGCDEIGENLNAVNCQFKIESIENLSWAGIDLSNVTSAADLSLEDVQIAEDAIANQDFDVNVSVNVSALNETESVAKIKGFDYVVLLDETELSSGQYDQETIVDPNGGIAILPIQMVFDATPLMANGDMADMMNLVENIQNYSNDNFSELVIKFSPWLPLGDSIQKMPYITLTHSFQ